MSFQSFVKNQPPWNFEKSQPTPEFFLFNKTIIAKYKELSAVRVEMDHLAALTDIFVKHNFSY
jgi:hypothetical protein